MDAVVDKCLHCEKPITRAARGRPQRFCCDAHRKAYGRLNGHERFGGILVPLAAAFFPRVRSNRLSLFLPASALLPTAVIAMGFKLAGIVPRPSEAVELYLYFFILGYLIIFALRIRELEIQEDAHSARGRTPHPA